MFTIVGSGFGLYGYLPALVETFDEAVILPEAYREKIAARPELRQYLDAVRWTPDADAALESATGVVVATPPRRQQEVVTRCLDLPAIQTLVLEKPVAVDPRMASRMLGDLKASGRRFRIGYTFLHTEWSSRLAWPHGGEADGEVAITWTFMAHHFAKRLETWKRSHPDGGGVLRFFGIQLLALLAHRGYRSVDRSTLTGDNAAEPEQWRALFSGPGIPDCRVVVDSRCGENRFNIAQGSASAATGSAVDLRDPFELEEAVASPPADRRIAVLKRVLGTFRSDDEAYCAFAEEVNRLWQRVETASH